MRTISRVARRIIAWTYGDGLPLAVVKVFVILVAVLALVDLVSLLTHL